MFILTLTKENVMFNLLKDLIDALVESELNNIMSVCIEAGADIDAEIANAVKYL